MGTVTTSNINTRAGSGSITMTWDGTNPLPTTSVEIGSLDGIDVDFDVEEKEDQASSVLFDLGKLKFKVFDKLANGDSFFEELDQIDANSVIDIEFSFTTNAGRSWTDLFEFTPTDIEYSRERREVSIEAAPVGISDTVSDIFSNNPGDLEDFNNGIFTQDIMPANRYLENVLALYGSGNTVINDSVFFADAGQTDGEESYGVFTRASGSVATLPLFKMAAVEGSVIGSFLGYNFFVNRLLTTSSVTIGEDDAEVLDISIGLNSYYAIREVFVGALDKSTDTFKGAISVADLTGDDDGLNSDALKRIDVFWDGAGVLDGVIWDNANTEYVDEEDAAIVKTGVYVNGIAKEGSTTIQVDDGTGGGAPIDVSNGDFIYFDSEIGDVSPVPFYVASGANTSSELSLTDPLINDVQDDSLVYVIQTSTRDNLSEKGADCYAAAYSATGANRVELVVFGIDTVKPYQSITFDSSFPAGLSGKIYRPSRLTYNFMRDIIKIEAYNIG